MSAKQTTVTVEVETRAPDVLPKAQIVKIDTEGSEVDILTRMASLDFDAIMLEYHSVTGERLMRCCRITCSPAATSATRTVER